MKPNKEQEEPKLNEPQEAYLLRESKTFQRIPGLAYTQEERMAELTIAEAEHKLGLHISSEELEEEMKTW